MKITLLSLLITLGACSFSQQMHITISAQHKTISVVTDEDNGDKILSLEKSTTPSDAYLIANLTHEEKQKDWKRNFIIYNKEDSEISRLALIKENTYGILLKDLFLQLQNGEEYSLYTIVLPEDSQKAMEVRVARQLVCKIEIN